MEEQVPLDHILELSQLRYEFSIHNDNTAKADLQKRILDIITKNKMGPYYDQTVAALGWKQDADLLQQLTADNAKELEDLEAKIKDAEENLGESEVREALLAKAQFFHRIGDKEKALTAYRVASDKTVALGQKLDIVFATLRIAISTNDIDLTRRNIEKAKSLIEEGGDWERRNRLKVYEGTFLIMVRDLERAAKLLLDSIATFTCSELLPYPRFIFYAVLFNMLHLDRANLKQKVINSSEVLAVIHEIPHLQQFLNSMYNCQYDKFLQALVGIFDEMTKDRILVPHAHFYCREMRVVVYQQYLASYRSVAQQSMANVFGLSSAFLDKELSTFIAAGRLSCKIDKVGGIIETNRPDAKNAHYQSTIKHGDLLLNRIQKLSRVVDL